MESKIDIWRESLIHRRFTFSAPLWTMEASQVYWRQFYSFFLPWRGQNQRESEREMRKWQKNFAGGDSGAQWTGRWIAPLWQESYSCCSGDRRRRYRRPQLHHGSWFRRMGRKVSSWLLFTETFWKLLCSFRFHCAEIEEFFFLFASYFYFLTYRFTLLYRGILVLFWLFPDHTASFSLQPVDRQTGGGSDKHKLFLNKTRYSAIAYAY